MQIHLTNEIDLDGQMEVVDQVYPVEVLRKKNQLYLMYTNEEQEKVVIKCDDKELSMTRFSSPKTLMRFLSNQEAIVVVPTPIGLQHFVTVTNEYQLDEEAQSIRLHYDLKQLEAEGIFASYRMEISWGNPLL
ncbi:DUF1934 domain-containing protein [Streptococcus ovis]|uniref:DUF1934 domain-containing protein n=1 Tax=Streptococcus ovis TaxID=82806 RepID=UPI00037D2217|nr:DUF1934 domain-containing protein [Streptococcus ovis]